MVEDLDAVTVGAVVVVVAGWSHGLRWQSLSRLRPPYQDGTSDSIPTGRDISRDKEDHI
jgi:hypothetical protein